MLERVLDFYRRKFWKPEKYARYIGVKIGNNCHIATRHFSSEPYLITIGDHVQITNDVKFFAHGGGWVFREKYPNFDTFGKIIVKNNVYIGNNSLLLPGVTIGNNVIIAAGSVVTKSIEDGLIVGGNPARVIGSVNDLEKRQLPFNLNVKNMSFNKKKEYLLSLDETYFIKK